MDKSFKILITCFVLELLAGMEVDLFVPSCNQLQLCFGLSAFMVELSFVINLIGYCLGAFLVSPFAEAYGKKKIVLWGCILFIFGSILCSFAESFSFLLVGRFIQGFGISMPCVLAYVIIVDNFTVEQQTKFLGYLHGAITIGMAIAPIIGSFVAHHFGWQGNFHVLTVFGVVTFLMSFVFIPKDQINLNKNNLDFFAILRVVKKTDVLFGAFSISFILQGFWVFTAISPILYVGFYKIELPLFGFYQGMLSAGFAIFSILGPYIIKKLGEKNSVKYSAQIMVFSGLLALACIVFDLPPLLITLTMFVHCSSNAITVLILWPSFINYKKEYQTERSSIATMLRLLVTAFCVQTASFFYKDVFMPIGIFIIFVSFLSYPLIMKAYSSFKSGTEHN